MSKSVLLLCLFSPLVSIAQSLDDIRITGTRVSMDEIGEPVLRIGKKGLHAALTGRADELCRTPEIEVVSIGDGRFTVEHQAMPLEELLAHIDSRGEEIDCVRVLGIHPGRDAINRMSSIVVDGHGASMKLDFEERVLD